jgi:hypothetical protein
LKKAETTIKEGDEPDIWHKIGYEPPVADANDGIVTGITFSIS